MQHTGGPAQTPYAVDVTMGGVLVDQDEPARPRLVVVQTAGQFDDPTSINFTRPVQTGMQFFGRHQGRQVSVVHHQRGRMCDVTRGHPLTFVNGHDGKYLLEATPHRPWVECKDIGTRCQMMLRGVIIDSGFRGPRRFLFHFIENPTRDHGMHRVVGGQPCVDHAQVAGASVARADDKFCFFVCVVRLVQPLENAPCNIFAFHFWFSSRQHVMKNSGGEI